VHEALWYEKLPGGKVHCFLCPRHCHIGDGQTGFCFVRKNVGGTLYSLAYGQPYAVHVDPVEKKPLFHFLPGTRIFSIGTAGCNMGCKFCQNWDISKAEYDQARAVKLSPDDAVQLARRYGCRSLAYTYNEPTIWAEYAVETSKLAHAAGLKTVMVTNGYATLEALRDIYAHIDAANVDLKAFSENFYRKLTLSHLQPVLEALVALRKMGVWIEITNLVIPTLNDSADEIAQMCRWILETLGDDVPLHFTAFHPDYKLTHLPPTPASVLESARKLAMEMGLRYVYLGNVATDEGSNTYCPRCGRLLIARSWHAVVEVNLDPQGHCRHCQHPICGILAA